MLIGNPVAREKLRKWLTCKPVWEVAMIQGPTGSGKSHTIQTLCKETGWELVRCMMSLLRQISLIQDLLYTRRDPPIVICLEHLETLSESELRVLKEVITTKRPTNPLLCTITTGITQGSATLRMLLSIGTQIKFWPLSDTDLRLLPAGGGYNHNNNNNNPNNGDIRQFLFQSRPSPSTSTSNSRKLINPTLPRQNHNLNLNLNLNLNIFETIRALLVHSKTLTITDRMELWQRQTIRQCMPLLLHNSQFLDPNWSDYLSNLDEMSTVAWQNCDEERTCLSFCAYTTQHYQHPPTEQLTIDKLPNHLPYSQTVKKWDPLMSFISTIQQQQQPILRKRKSPPRPPKSSNNSGRMDGLRLS